MSLLGTPRIRGGTGGGTGGGQVGFPVNYCSDAAAFPAFGAPYSPDGIPVVNGETILFTDISPTIINRGVYRATVVAGNLTALTRVVYNPTADPNGYSTQNDVIFVLFGNVYANYTFVCTSTPLRLWVGTGVPYPQLYHEIWINTSVSEQLGVQYWTFANAIAYIMTQTPSATNRWVIKCSEEIGLRPTMAPIMQEASITLQPYVYIDLNTSGFISCPVYSAGGFTGDFTEYQLFDGEVQDLRTECLAMYGGLISGADLPNGAFLFTDGTAIYNGDFTTQHMVDVSTGLFNPATYVSTNAPYVVNISNCNVFGGYFKSTSLTNVSFTDSLSNIIPGNPNIYIDGIQNASNCNMGSNPGGFKFKFGSVDTLLASCFVQGPVIPTAANHTTRLVNSSLLGQVSGPGTINFASYSDDGVSAFRLYGTNLNIIYTQLGNIQVHVVGISAPGYNGVHTITGGAVDPTYGAYLSFATTGVATPAFPIPVVDAGIIDWYFYNTTGYETTGGYTTFYVDSLVGILYPDMAVKVSGLTDTAYNSGFKVTDIDAVAGTVTCQTFLPNTVGIIPDTGGKIEDISAGGQYSVVAMYNSTVNIASCPIISKYEYSGSNLLITGDFNEDPYKLINGGSTDEIAQINKLAQHRTFANVQDITPGNFLGVKFDTLSGKWILPTTADEIAGISYNTGTSNEEVIFTGMIILGTTTLTDGPVYFNDTTFALQNTPATIKAGYVFTDTTLGKVLNVKIEPVPVSAGIASINGDTSSAQLITGSGNISVDSASTPGTTKLGNVVTNTLVSRYEFLDGTATSDSLTLPDPTTSLVQEYVVEIKALTYPVTIFPHSILNKFVFPGNQYRNHTYPGYQPKSTGIVRFLTNLTDWYVDESGLDRTEARTTIHDEYINTFGKEWQPDAGNTGTVAWGTTFYDGLILETGATSGDYMRYDWGGAKRISLIGSQPSFDMKMAHNFLNLTNRTVGYQLSGTTVRLNVDSITGLIAGSNVVISDSIGGTLPTYYLGAYILDASGTDGNGPYIEYTIGAGHGPDSYTACATGYCGVPYTTMEFGFEDDSTHYVKFYRTPANNAWCFECCNGGSALRAYSVSPAYDGTWDRFSVYFRALSSGLYLATIEASEQDDVIMALTNTGGEFPTSSNMQPYFKITTNANAKANLLVKMTEVSFNNI